MWKPFTDAVILVADKTDPVFILWGRVALGGAAPPENVALAPFTHPAR
jgi:uracil DNA glycosylase